MKIFKLFLFLLLFLSLSDFCFAQTPPWVKLWDKRFGGIYTEYFYMFQQTTDRGYILGGFTSSPKGGDITESKKGGWDYWIVKTDSMGNKQWDKRYGNGGSNVLYALQQTTDGGYLIGGWAMAGIGGDKTEPSQGKCDFWILKIDALGIKQWDKTFGGTGDDQLISLLQTTDGGFILGGYSDSGISGDKTEPSRGGLDYWIVKIDALGAKQWDKTFGGTADEGGLSELFQVSQTADGGYILGGYSQSGSNGDRTEPSRGGKDYWIVKINSLGIKQWDKRFGGASDDQLTYVVQTADKGYIMGGQTKSGVGGDKTQPNWGTVWKDLWIVKTDSLGNKEWDKRFGGTDDEHFGNILVMADGGYLLAGNSYSVAGGDKTENKIGLEHGWIIKIDSLGIKQWDKTVFTAGHDETCNIVQSNDGGYVVAGYTDSHIGGYKSESNWDGGGSTPDYWIIKFKDSTSCIAGVAGTISALRDTICSGTPGSLSLTGNSGPVQWQSSFVNENFTNISGATSNTYLSIPSQTTYFRTVAGNGSCGDTSSVFRLIVAPSPVAIFDYTVSNLEVNFNSSGSSGDITLYDWNFGDNTTSTAVNPVHAYSQQGTYHVCLTVENGSNCSYTICKDVPVLIEGILKLTEEREWNIYPNPFNENIFIQSEISNPKIESIEIYDVLGRIVEKISFANDEENRMINTSDLARGMYCIKIKTSEMNYVIPLMKE